MPRLRAAPPHRPRRPVVTTSSLTGTLRDTAGNEAPGIAVAIVDADGIRDAVGIGMADIAKGRTASAEMV